MAHFLAVWPVLLAIHEAGHAIAARQQGLAVRRVTVGAGPILWRGSHNETDLVLRLVPVVGLTRLDQAGATSPPATTGRWSDWRREGGVLAGGVLATLCLAIGMAMAVGTWERGTQRRWVWGRIVVADAVVLTIFNFFPVPPLDGGRAVLAVLAAVRGSPLPDHALFWVHVGGLALAVVPMALWTRWTARIDRTALWWRAPGPHRSTPSG